MREIETNKEGVKRFKRNKIVRYLIDTHSNCDMNLLWKLTDGGLFSKEELKEFYQLIGCSIDGYNELFEEVSN